MKRFCLSLALAAAASPSLACPQLPESEQIAAAQAEEVEARSIVNSHLAEADDVFVGRLLELDHLESSKVGEKRDEQDIAVFRVRLDPIRIIKGAPTAATIYTFERRESIQHVGCSSLLGAERISFDDGPGYRFIVYARAGTILRANLVVDWFDGLSSGLELEMLEQALVPNGAED